MEDRNPFADALILSLYRWIKSTSSKLHDPALQRLLQGLMKKARDHGEPLSVDACAADWRLTAYGAAQGPGACPITSAGRSQAFLQLLAEFRRLGATIIYANFNQVRPSGDAVRVARGRTASLTAG